MTKLAEMSNEELNKLIEAYEVNIAEIEEEKKFVLGQSGLHITGSKLRQYEEEIESYKLSIKKAQKIIAER